MVIKLSSTVVVSCRTYKEWACHPRRSLQVTDGRMARKVVATCRSYIRKKLLQVPPDVDLLVMVGSETSRVGVGTHVCHEADE